MESPKLSLEAPSYSEGASEGSERAAHARRTPSDPSPLYVVDGFNLMHAVVLRGRDRKNWWNAEKQERVVRLVETFDLGEACVVFDAAKPDSERFSGPSHIQVHFHPSADDFIVQLSERLQAERPVFVISSDRALQDRARRFGARRMSPWEFCDACTLLED